MNPDKKKLKKILKLIPSDKTLKIIDAGCFKGDVTSFLHKRGYQNIIGIDFDRNVIQANKSRFKNIKFKYADVHNINFSKYDLVIAWGLFEYTLDFEKLLKRIEKELHSGATLIMSVPNVVSISKRIRSLLGFNPNREKLPHLTFTIKEIENIINTLDFEIKEIHSLFSDGIMNVYFPTPKNLSSDIIVKLVK